MSHNQEPYRLKADSRQQIEDAIPFELYREDEEGETFVPATADYSYKFLDWEWEVEPEYNEDDEIINDPVKSDHVLADLMDYREDAEEIDFGKDVEVLTDIETPMHGWT